MKYSNTVQILLFCLVVILPAAGFGWSGEVVRVSSGDTVTVYKKDHKTSIRLYGVDAPEIEQSYGIKARGFSTSLVANKHVTVEELSKDTKGLITAIIILNNKSLNGELVRSGYAWVSPESCNLPECAEWQIFEKAAKAGGKGLWEEADPVPPWEWRKNNPKNIIAKFLRLIYTFFSLNAPPQ